AGTALQSNGALTMFGTLANSSIATTLAVQCFMPPPKTSLDTSSGRKQAARYSARDNKHMVPISALLKIAKAGYVLPEVLPIAEILRRIQAKRSRGKKKQDGYLS